MSSGSHVHTPETDLFRVLHSTRNAVTSGVPIGADQCWAWSIPGTVAEHKFDTSVESEMIVDQYSTRADQTGE
jgi:hypothetical protein